MFFKKNLTVKNIAFVLLVLFLIWFIGQIADITLIFFAAFVIACSLNPLVDKMSKKISRMSATVIALTLMFVVAFGVLIPVGILAYREISDIVQFLPVAATKAIAWLKSAYIMGYKLTTFVDANSLNFDPSSIFAEVLGKSMDITMGIADGLTAFFSIAMIVFYLVYEKDYIHKSYRRLFPVKMKKRASEILSTIETKVGGYVVAQLLSMSTVGLFTVIGLMICKIEYSLLLGTIAGVLDIIPIIGPTIALALGLIAAVSKGWLWTLPVTAVFLLAQWLSNQFVRPVVFGKLMQIHPLTVIFAFLAAAKFLGVWGVILAPAIASLILTLFDELYIKTVNGKNEQ